MADRFWGRVEAIYGENEWKAALHMALFVAIWAGGGTWILGYWG